MHTSHILGYHFHVKKTRNMSSPQKVGKTEYTRAVGVWIRMPNMKRVCTKYFGLILTALLFLIVKPVLRLAQGPQTTSHDNSGATCWDIHNTSTYWANPQDDPLVYVSVMWLTNHSKSSPKHHQVIPRWLLYYAWYPVLCPGLLCYLFALLLAYFYALLLSIPSPSCQWFPEVCPSSHFQT